MAVEALFHVTIEELKTAVRLGSANQAGTVATFERAVQEVRLEFYQRLGSARIDQLRSFAVEDNPTDSNGLARLKAITAETIWVKLKLIYELPMLFMDSSGQVEEVWNEESLTRDAGSLNLSQLESKLKERLFEILEDLEGNADQGSAQVTLIEPDDTPPRPGDTVNTYYGRKLF